MKKLEIKIEAIKKMLESSPEMAMPNIAAIIIIFMIILTFIQGVMGIKQITKKNISHIQENIQSIDNSDRLILEIPQWHLLGLAPVSADNLAQTHLQLVLNGVMTSQDKTKAYAIIGAPGKNQKLYRIQDSLPGGATLYQINPQGIVIQYQGELQQLPLLKPGQ